MCTNYTIEPSKTEKIIENNYEIIRPDPVIISAPIAMAMQQRMAMLVLAG